MENKKAKTKQNSTAGKTPKKSTAGKTPKKSTAGNTLQKRYLSLSPRDQIGVTNFFNMHNAAHYIYDGLTEDAQNYVNYCIRLSTNADKIEKQNEKTE